MQSHERLTAASTIISTFNSLTLSPALAALLLKPRNAPPDAFQRAINKVLGGFFRVFNRVFERASDRYGHGVSRLAALRGAVLAVFAVLLVCTWGMFHVVPGGFIPAQDKQYLDAVRGAHDQGSVRGRDRGRAQQEVRRHPGCRHFRSAAAARAGPRQHGRIQAVHSRSGGARLRRACPRHQRGNEQSARAA
jgi:multidrug efflux pump subunit AcrB